MSAKAERAPVGRPSDDLERELTILAYEEEAGPDLEELVEEALRGEPAALALVTERVLARIDEREHYRSAGRIAALVAKLATPRSERERPWVPVSGEVEIEDWTTREGAGRPRRDDPMSARFATLEEVVSDPVFPEVDVALRRGRHIDRDDGEWYAFVVDAQDHLEPLYRRYGCELVTQSDLHDAGRGHRGGEPRDHLPGSRRRVVWTVGIGTRQLAKVSFPLKRNKNREVARGGTTRGHVG